MSKRKFGMKKIRIHKAKNTCFATLHFLVRNRRAASAVVSNLILIGAVITVGLVVLAYARTTSLDYQTDYSEAVNLDIRKMKESLSFEYVHYDSSSKGLSVYFLNPGTVDYEVKSLVINDSPAYFTLYRMNDTQRIANCIVEKGAEVYLVSDLSSMINNLKDINKIEIITRSGSSFAYNFMV